MASPKDILNNLLTILKDKQYAVFTRPFELNLVGLRAANPTSGKFDDEIYCFYKDAKDNWHLHVWPATTDPGIIWLDNPMAPDGTALLAQGQYKHVYKLGMHRGRSRALIQAKPVTVWRMQKTASGYKPVGRATGMFGINLHKPGISKEPSMLVGLDSAGCQVPASAKDHDLLLQLADRHLKLYPEGITYSLVDFRAYTAADRFNTFLLIITSAAITYALFLIGRKVKLHTDKHYTGSGLGSLTKLLAA